jgi:hypothetical protein
MGDLMFGDTGKILNKAVGEFAGELGRQLEAQRTAAGFGADDFCLMLNGIGMTLSVEELGRLESGEQAESLEPRLLLAFTFLLEFSVDKVLFACLQRAAIPEETDEDGDKTS